jgi:hypothetical protein
MFAVDSRVVAVCWHEQAVMVDIEAEAWLEDGGKGKEPLSMIDGVADQEQMSLAAMGETAGGKGNHCVMDQEQLLLVAMSWDWDWEAELNFEGALQKGGRGVDVDWEGSIAGGPPGCGSMGDARLGVMEGCALCMWGIERVQDLLILSWTFWRVRPLMPLGPWPALERSGVCPENTYAQLADVRTIILGNIRTYEDKYSRLVTLGIRLHSLSD